MWESCRGSASPPIPRTDGHRWQKAIRAAAMKALSSEIDARAEKVSGKAANEDFVLTSDGSRSAGRANWSAKLYRVRKPAAALGILVLSDEQLTGDRIWTRCADAPRIVDPPTASIPCCSHWSILQKAEDLEGIARGIAFRLVENTGILDRRDVSEDVRQLDQDRPRRLAQIRRPLRRLPYFRARPCSSLRRANCSTSLWALHTSLGNGEGGDADLHFRQSRSR